jgi:uncharacterized protein (DUF1330 family)
MKYYFVAQIRIEDDATYQKYLDEVDRVFSLYKGEYLAVDENPVVIEGKWNYSKSVIIKFNSKKDFRNWYYSDDYQTILKFRLNSSKSDSILIKGIV